MVASTGVTGTTSTPMAESDRVGQREPGHDPEDASGRSGEEKDACHKQEVVDATEDVLDAQSKVLHRHPCPRRPPWHDPL